MGLMDFLKKAYDSLESFSNETLSNLDKYQQLDDDELVNEIENTSNSAERLAIRKALLDRGYITVNGIWIKSDASIPKDSKVYKDTYSRLKDKELIAELKKIGKSYPKRGRALISLLVERGYCVKEGEWVKK